MPVTSLTCRHAALIHQGQAVLHEKQLISGKDDTSDASNGIRCAAF
jgi:hypothetical protein